MPYAAPQNIVIKLSGKMMTDDCQWNWPLIAALAAEFQTQARLGLFAVLVVGGGNVIRGRESDAKYLPRQFADQMGMLATNINALALAGSLQVAGLATQAMSAVPVDGMLPKISKGALRRARKNGSWVACGGGIGEVGHSTDLAAMARAVQIDADLVIKLTDVDGVYDSDPDTNPQAKKIAHLTYAQAISQNLQVMDIEAWQLAQSHKIPTRVIQWSPGNFTQLMQGENIGTLLTAA